MSLAKITKPSIAIFIALALLCTCLLFSTTITVASAEVSSPIDGEEYYIYVPILDEDLLAGILPSPTSILASHEIDSSKHFVILSGYYYPVVYESNAYYLNCFNLSGYLIDESSLSSEWIFSSSEIDTSTIALYNIQLSANTSSPFWDSWGEGESSDYTFTFVGYSDPAKTYLFILATSTNGVTSEYEIIASAFESFTISLSTLDESRLASLQTTSNDSTTSGTSIISTLDLESDSIRIALIVGIAVPLVIITLLLFKRSKAKGGDVKVIGNGNNTSPIDYDRDRNYSDDRARYDRGYRAYERYDYRRDYDRDRYYDPNYDNKRYYSNDYYRNYPDDYYRN